MSRFCSYSSPKSQLPSRQNGLSLSLSLSSTGHAPQCSAARRLAVKKSRLVPNVVRSPFLVSLRKSATLHSCCPARPCGPRAAPPIFLSGLAVEMAGKTHGILIGSDVLSGTKVAQLQWLPIPRSLRSAFYLAVTGALAAWSCPSYFEPDSPRRVRVPLWSVARPYSSDSRTENTGARSEP